MGPSYQSVSPSNFGYYNAPKKRLNMRFLLTILGIVVVLFVGFAIVAHIATSDNLDTQEQHLTLRLQNLTTLTENAANQLQSDDMLKINAEAYIINVGVTTSVASYLPSTSKIDKSIVADESTASINSTLSSAAAAGTYDTQYRQVLQQQLESISALLSEMYGKAKSTTLKNTLNTDYINYQKLLKNLQAINV